MSIEALVDRGLEIRRQLEQLEAELCVIEGRLKETGLQREHEYLKDEDREGRRWLAHGSEQIVPVVFTADKIMGSFAMDSATAQTVRTIAGDSFPDFWKLKRVYENRFDDGKKFRDRAAEILNSKAPSFITACLARDKHGIPKSDIRILWDDAEVPAAPANGKAVKP
jgi:hypothetical protein